MTNDPWRDICNDLSAKASNDMMEVLLRTTLLAPDSRMGALISVESSVFLAVQTIASLAAQMGEEGDAIIVSLFDELKGKCLRKKQEFAERLKDPAQRAEFEAQTPSYWKD